MPGFWCSAQHFGNILAIFKPVVGDFCELFSNQGFFDSLVGRLRSKGNNMPFKYTFGAYLIVNEMNCPGSITSKVPPNTVCMKGIVLNINRQVADTNRWVDAKGQFLLVYLSPQ